MVKVEVLERNETELVPWTRERELLLLSLSPRRPILKSKIEKEKRRGDMFCKDFSDLSLPGPSIGSGTTLGLQVYKRQATQDLKSEALAAPRKLISKFTPYTQGA